MLLMLCLSVTACDLRLVVLMSWSIGVLCAVLTMIVVDRLNVLSCLAFDLLPFPLVRRPFDVFLPEVQ